MLALIICIGLLTTTASIFCSASCALSQCTGPNSNQCTGCDYPFILSGTTCLLDTSTNYELLADTADITFNLDSFTDSCGSYSYYGSFITSTLRFRYSTTITEPHYAVRFIMWVFLEDQWDLILDQFDIENLNTGEVVYQGVDTASATEDLGCGLSYQDESYMKIDVELTHTTTADVVITFDTYNYNFNFFGVKEYMMLLSKCDSICSSCFGPTNQECNNCKSPYWLSGNVCNQTCLDKYGQSSTDTLCISCHSYCTQCYLLSTNCSSCQTSGIYESFLLNNVCYLTCPSRYAPSTLNHTCEPCTDNNCLSCSTQDYDMCFDCDSGSYWLDYDCYTVCPDGFYQDITNCTECDLSCTICSDFPSPCSECSDDYFLYSNQCIDECPVGFFGNENINQCLDCSVHCVTADLSLSVNSDGHLVATITFSQKIDFSNFPTDSFLEFSCSSDIDFSRFTFSTQIINSYSYSRKMEPSATFNFTGLLFTVEVAEKTTNYTSKDGNYFSDTIYLLNDSAYWSLLQLPQMDQQGQQTVQNLSKFNNWVNKILGAKGVQEVKKTGIFAILFSGAQLSSTIILCNTVPAQNMYEGARFWSSFIYFEVPEWEADGELTKYMMAKNASELIENNEQSARLLQTSESDNWRLQRTGHSTYFIIDNYFQCGMILLCWLLVLVVKCYDRRTKTNKLKTNTKSILYNICHKVHEICLFYIAMGIVLEAVAFDQQNSGLMASLSLGISILALIYFLCYHMIIFYRVIPYAFLHLSSPKYERYVEKFSYFLRDLRFAEYHKNSEWSFRHLFRPYNYQLLSYIRLVLFVTCIPLFQNFNYGCIICLTLIQCFEIVRFFLTWPYHSLWRNLYRIVQQFSLLSILFVYLILDIQIRSIYSRLNTLNQDQITLYYVVGWAGFVLIFFYNFLFIAYQIIDIVIGCKYTNRQRMEASRQAYYSELLNQFEEKEGLLGKGKQIKPSESKFIKCINRLQDTASTTITDQTSRLTVQAMIKKGNLTDINFNNLRILQIKVEEYIISQSHIQDQYEVELERIPVVFMRLQINPKKKSNLLIPERPKKKTSLKKHDPNTRPYFQVADKIFMKYGKLSTDTINIKTYLKADQNLYGAGQEIPQIPKLLKQKIEIKSYNGSTEMEWADEMLPGFPISIELIKQLESSKSS